MREMLEDGDKAVVIQTCGAEDGDNKLAASTGDLLLIIHVTPNKDWAYCKNERSKKEGYIRYDNLESMRYDLHNTREAISTFMANKFQEQLILENMQKSIPPPPLQNCPLPEYEEDRVNVMYYVINSYCTLKSSEPQQQLPLHKGEMVLRAQCTLAHNDNFVYVESCRMIGRKGFISRIHLTPANSFEAKPWYLGSLSREDAEALLGRHVVQPRTFIVRQSDTTSGFVITIKNDSAEEPFRHRKVKQDRGLYWAWNGFLFPSIEELVETHMTMTGEMALVYMYDKGMPHSPNQNRMLTDAKLPKPNSQKPVLQAKPVIFPPPPPALPKPNTWIYGPPPTPNEQAPDSYSSEDSRPPLPPRNQPLRSSEVGTMSEELYGTQVSKCEESYAETYADEQFTDTSSISTSSSTKSSGNFFKTVKTLIPKQNRPRSVTSQTSRTSPLPIQKQEPKTPPPKPATQLSTPLDNDWHIEPESVKFISRLGSGNYGEVWKAEWIQNQNAIVAVKTFNQETLQLDDFTNEVNTMVSLRHPNLVKLHGFCFRPTQRFVLLEYVKNGSVCDYMRHNQIPQLKKISISCQVADGMKYLSESGFIHRDLAARNVLLAEDLRPRIADFGLAKLTQIDDHHPPKSIKMPYKWTAPEVLRGRGQWSSKCDVWSYGVFCWELWSNCQEPYSGIRGGDNLYSHIIAGGRLEQPPQCDTKMYELMLHCWDLDSNRRIHFEFITQYFSVNYRDI